MQNVSNNVKSTVAVPTGTVGKRKSVSVLSPATVANVVCGFDILGFALNNPNDVFTISLSEEKGITIINDDEYDLPLDPVKNVSGAALIAFQQKTD